MKVSLITTVKNEGSNIKKFLNSVIEQTLKPNEFIIVDGGSKDNTVQVIENFSKKYKWIKLIKTSGATIGKGRNMAIENAKNEIIACTDAGCFLDKNWLKYMFAPFKKKNIDVVVGMFAPHYTNDFEYFQGNMVTPKAEDVFMSPSRMSSRSIAFRKSVFKKTGGYPDLITGEDTAFNLTLIRNHAKFAFAKNAIVYWGMRKTWKQFFKQFYNYGKGDRMSGNIWKMKKNLLFALGFYIYFIAILGFLFINWIYSAIMFSVFVLFFFYQGTVLAVKTGKIKGIFYGFLLNLIKRIAYALGIVGKK